MRVSPIYSEVCGGVGAVLLALAPWKGGAWGIAAFIIGVGAIFVGILFRAWQNKYEQESYRHVIRSESLKVRDYLASLNMMNMRPRSAIVVEGKREREKHLHAARQATLEFARHALPSSDNVRVNLFTVSDSERFCLEAPRWGVAGTSSKASDRIFSMKDESLKKAVAGEGRLEEDVSRLPGKYSYGSFATAPVFAGEGLYGLLTADSRDSYGLAEVDLQILISIASGMAITFAVEAETKFIDMKAAGALARVEETEIPGGDRDES
ncbi:hypothetical protein V5S96_04345 [Corynebacterium mastitidis]|uniref:GAF domain-containing protein n=1 Tax=Corynebacterium mastitidis TaxID=161890 RepID=A0ABU8NXA6_9CORY